MDYLEKCTNCTNKCLAVPWQIFDLKFLKLYNLPNSIKTLLPLVQMLKETVLLATVGNSLVEFNFTSGAFTQTNRWR
jgi:hypothetical protein